jgi:phage terminase large subunit
LTVKDVRLAYSPRTAFRAFHERTQRWAAMVVHRRAGKTVACINDTVRAAITNPRAFPPPAYGYIAPFRSQAKKVAWSYLKHYARPIIKTINEAELTVTLVTDATISLFGADNPDAMRGVFWDGVTCDEYGDFKPSVWGDVIRPALADRQGWAVFIGTAKGRNQFYEQLERAKKNSKEWFFMDLKASESGILPQSELDDIRAQVDEDQYLREMENSFDAAIKGAYYGTLMRAAAEDTPSRIGRVSYDKSIPTYTAWDLGYRDDTAIWWYQVIRGEIHFIDYYAVSGADIEAICKVVKAKPYHYAKHLLPHDARAKTLASGGKSIIEQIAVHLGFNNLGVVPDIGVQDGIQAVRLMLPHSWFDAERCYEGVEALKQYQREYDEDKRAFRETPRHDWTSHPSDAIRMAAVAWKAEAPAPSTRANHRLMVGHTNLATLEDMYEDVRNRRRERI